jgi:hypothetical protein
MKEYWSNFLRKPVQAVNKIPERYEENQSINGFEIGDQSFHIDDAEIDQDIDFLIDQK